MGQFSDINQNVVLRNIGVSLAISLQDVGHTQIHLE